ncbi:MAG: glycine--tRNA ligase subunit beta [Gammaproteobacteria bacterium]
MTTTHDFLIEIGTEELPARSLHMLSQAFSNHLTTQLQKAELSFNAVHSYATPRRLAVLITDLASTQKSHMQERKGPAVSAAFNADGKPTSACLGFARSCGIPVEQLQVEKTAKGEWLVHRYEQPGESTEKLLPSLVHQTITQLPIPRPMRWGTRHVSFLRPVHWVVMLLDDKLIEAEFFGLNTTRQTRGHRFHHPQGINIRHAKDYTDLLMTTGKVIADFNTRKENIRTQVEKIAGKKGCNAKDPGAELLDEVTGLVEWPVALLGNFSEHFLELPKEVLITSMRQHQKCFALLDRNNKLAPHFITIANIESKNPQQVIAGNEKVMQARLSDAAFFYHQDRKHRLESRLENLKTIIFQQQLGSLYDKALRISQLSDYIANLWSNINHEQVKRAGLLAKADLLSAMVGEFPELQGIMGSYYARADGEPEEVANAIYEHYQPRGANDKLPESAIGCVLAIADRVDTLIGIFGINQAPTGEKDPFGLRRAALAILRIIIQYKLPLDLKKLLEKAQQQYQDQVALPNAQAVDQALTFIFERLRAWYAEQQITPDVFAAVSALKLTQPLDFDLRIRAVQHFKQLPQAAALAAANKRVSNILKKEDSIFAHAQVNPALLEEEAERDLQNVLEQKNKEVEQLCRQTLYTEALSSLASLQQPIDLFFDTVLVMTPDENLRRNRLALLNQLRQLFLQIADVSLLQG